ncbi:myosin light chain kinase, smooth muscle-like [Petromyzon marinus]|uniref:myosin light chain kinase, smooth muscle-like n=1 Tax=Petromyzon marinus TaxID=7757 RepID=UPI003F70F219
MAEATVKSISYHLHNGELLPRERKLEDFFELKEEISRGLLGTLFRAVEKASGRAAHARFVNAQRHSHRAECLNEAELLYGASHPNVLQLLDVYHLLDTKQMVLVTEPVDGGPLFERLSGKGYALTERKVSGFVKQLCLALQHLHSLNVLHLDVKPECLWLASRDSEQLKLMQFGCAQRYTDNLKVSQSAAEFAAPEMLTNEAIACSTDMWGVGLLAYVMLSGVSPFWAASDDVTVKKVVAATYSFPEEGFKAVSQPAREFISKLLVKAPPKRLGAEDALKHPWLANPAGDAKLSTERLHAFWERRKAQKTTRGTHSVSKTSHDVTTMAVVSVSYHLHNGELLPRERKLEDFFELKEEISRGLLGTLFRAVEKASGRAAHARFVNAQRHSHRAECLNEAELLYGASHPNVLQLLDVYHLLDTKQMVLVTEPVEGGELFERLSGKGFALTERKVSGILKQLCLALQHLHSLNVLHLDVKPECLWLASRESDELKVAGLGCALRYQDNLKAPHQIPVPEFAAPEVVANEVVTFNTDAWPVGLLACVMLSGVSPFWDQWDSETVKKVVAATYSLPEEEFKAVSRPAREFISKLLVKAPPKRLGVADALKHPWLANPAGDAKLPTERLHAFWERRKEQMKSAVTSTSLASHGSASQKNDKKSAAKK